MPPKAKKADTGKRFTDPKFHYNEAYRAEIKRRRTRWTSGKSPLIAYDLVIC
jgi:hypothetical protein